MELQLRDKEQQLYRVLARYDRTAVAFSGGADSSLLLRCAIKILGPGNVVALTSRSCLLKSYELDKVTGWFADHGLPGSLRHLFVDIDPLSWHAFTANPEDRCYQCKSRVYSLFRDRTAEMGITSLIDGTNADDLRSDRPGLRALRELGVGTPLAEAGLSKKDVRELSREAGLNTWNRPSSSCLATRIPNGMEITRERIDLVGRAESVLEEMGFAGCRVRLDRSNAGTAKLEVQNKDLPAITLERNRSYILDKFREIGFSSVLLDICGR